MKAVVVMVVIARLLVFVRFRALSLTSIKILVSAHSIPSVLVLYHHALLFIFIKFFS